MSEQITVKQVRGVMETMKPLIPIMNQEEFNELMRFNNRVLDRYIKEHYPDGSPAESDND